MVEAAVEAAVGAAVGAAVVVEAVSARETRADGELAAACLAAAEADPQHPTAAAVDALLARAWAWGASDLHVSPGADEFRLRLRLDGVLEDMGRVPRARLPLLVQRLKVLAGLLTYRSDVPQDGRVAASADGARGELRVSVLPTLHGEKAVVRLLGQAGPRSLDQLGWPAPAQAALRRALAARQGLVAFAGPAGSGKTTAIYAGLRALGEQGGRSLCSIEEPVEAELPGVDQTPVDRRVGLDFAQALRAQLRQDPEVIFVGEVRDRETAHIAVEAGLTGHLILTTVHAASACEALARLLDLHPEPGALASALELVFAQRLVRRRCARCAGAGGACCRGTGFRGRLPLVEHLPLERALRAALSERASADRLHELARAQGLRALVEVGQDALAAGETTADELRRVLGSIA